MARQTNRDGNSEQLLKLEGELKHSKAYVDVLEKRCRSFEEKIAEQTKFVGDLRKSLDIAGEKILFLETGSKTAKGEIPEGYVEIATLSYKDTKPSLNKVDGIVVPRRIDEDGIFYETLPVKKAIALLSEKSCFKRYLVGPKTAQSIKGQVQVGLYMKDAEYYLHKKSRDLTGKYEFVRLIIE